MKILLIAPASGEWRGIAHKPLFNGKTFRFSMLSLLTLAELSPADAEITIIDEQMRDIPWDSDFDIVGITVMTATAPRAYSIANRFRRRGVRVVLGGFHPTLNPDEALRHADAVVEGPAYGAWQRLVADATAGTLKQRYSGSADEGVPCFLPRQLMDGSKYLTANATFATLGCRNKCRFCSITAFHKCTLHCRPVDDVVREIASFKRRFFMFVDDNLTQDRAYARELLEQLVPLKKKWVTQASVDIAEEPGMLALLRSAGCVGLFMGLETFDDEVLAEQGKQCNSPERYRRAVAAVHRHGMFVEAGIMLGFDSDTVGSFKRTLGMLDRIGIDAIQASIVTPVPGTPLFEDMRERIVDRDWEHYDYRHAVFTPAGMTRRELQAGADWVIRGFYSPWRIVRRMFRWLTIPSGWRQFVYPLALNLAYLGRVHRFNIRGYNPGRDTGKSAVHTRYGLRRHRRLLSPVSSS